MKISILTIIAFMLITLSSCKKEDLSMKIDTETLTLKLLERHQFIIKRGDKVYKREQFDWISSDISIVNLNGTGLIQAAKEGVATITATHSESPEFSVKCVVTVIK